MTDDDTPMRQSGSKRRVLAGAAAVLVDVMWFALALYVVPAVIPAIRDRRPWSDLGVITLVEDGAVICLVSAVLITAVRLDRITYRFVMGQRW